MRKLLVLIVLFLTISVVAQEKATVVGKVTDKEMNDEALPFANVYIKGTTIGTTTDFDGNYTLSLEEGEYTISFSFVGYATAEQTITVEAGMNYTVNQAVGASEGVLMDEVIVKGSSKKESVSALIAEQKKAVVIVESVGAQQLSSQGVSDAASATAKVTGVSKQQGSSKVYVRGLGDRYNSTTLNGLPLPSNDPSLKNISLDLFSTDIIQNVGISKTFSSNATGDFGGANINVVTKQASTSSNFAVSVSTGMNSQTTFKSFKTIDGANYVGVASHVNHPITSLKQYSFQDSFSPNRTTAAPAIGVSLNGGKKYFFDNGTSFSFFLVGSFDNNYRYNDGFSTNNKTEDLKGTDYYDAKQYSYTTSKLLMGNFEFSINENHKLLYNSVFIHSNGQKIQDYFGDTNDNENVNVILQTQNQNMLLVNQLISKNKVGEYVDLDLGVAYNNIKNDEPNRMKNTFLVDPETGEAKFATGSPRNNSRYYHNLNENDIAVNLVGKIYLGERDDDETKGAINLGYSLRNTDRDFEATYFDHNILNPTVIVDRDNLDEYFNQDNLDLGNNGNNNEGFKLTTGYGFGSKALNPFTYSGKRLINAVNASIDYNISEKLFVNLGGRFEQIDMDVDWSTNLTGGKLLASNIDKQYLLPTLNLKYSLNDENQFRFSASQTYTYPQFKEIAEFVYEGVDYTEQGNRNLQPSENINLDVKYEYFPSKGGLFSASVFAKMIENSINRIELVAASENQFSYDNTGDAQVYGLELEFKTTLLTLGDVDSDNYNKLNWGINSTLMYSNQNLKPTGLFNPTNTSSQLEGAAPVIVNTDLSYVINQDDKKTIATVVFNYQSDKLYSIGSNQGGIGLENIVQKSIATLDFVGKHSFNEKLTIKLAVKNILDPSIERVRDLSNPLTNRSYKRGIDTGLSLEYNF
ncbi:TonB-dependent receptor [Flavicella marina]|uniref:TonB-dependent receptor n=1 Tax=Flavicella marina TaxID=1475951 RepID=UPI001263F123|nr:TonB-dependent receptor [Flavicella marina]